MHFKLLEPLPFLIVPFQVAMQSSSGTSVSNEDGQQKRYFPGGWALEVS